LNSSNEFCSTSGEFTLFLCVHLLNGISSPWHQTLVIRLSVLVVTSAERAAFGVRNINFCLRTPMKVDTFAG